MTIYMPGPCTSPYISARKNPKTGAVKPHRGIDIGLGDGTPIPSAASGTIWYVGTGSGYGNTVIVNHGYSPTAGGVVFTVYGHMQSQPSFNFGDPVGYGSSVGNTGNTGVGTGPHLHFEVVVVPPGGRSPASGIGGASTGLGGVPRSNPSDFDDWPPGTQNPPFPSLPYPLPSNCPNPKVPGVKGKVGTASKTRSPVVLDLNGDGFGTTSVTDGAYFDHDANGFAEQTAWASPEDGLLVRDLDGNGSIDTGRELFGSETLLASGQKAANGYEALAELDDNHDGRIDAQDSAWTTLKIWKDADGDGYSLPEELFSLAEAGVQSLNVAYTTAGQTDDNGNIIQQTGTFTKTDGNVGVSADVWFQVDNTYTIPAEWLEETDAIAALPDLEGYGNVHNLHQAMLRDSSGRLQSLVGQFINETDPAARKLTPLVLFGSVSPDYRGNPYLHDMPIRIAS